MIIGALRRYTKTIEIRFVLVQKMSLVLDLILEIVT